MYRSNIRELKGRRIGFTLIELLVGLVVSMITLTVVAGAFMAVTQTFQKEAQVRSGLERLRVINTYLERTTRNAGYGIDPRFAFDVSTTGLPNSTKDNHQGTTSTGIPFVTDDLAFRYRDLSYLRRGTVTLNQVTLDGTGSYPTTFGTQLPANQPLIISCFGAKEYIVVRTSTAVGSGEWTTAVTQYGAPFETFGLPPLRSLPSCFANTGVNAPFIMLMYDVRLRVVDLGGRPFLVAFHNMDPPDPSTNTDFDPISDGVENFQVAYLMNRPSMNSECCGPTASTPVTAPDNAGNQNWVMGDAGDPDGTLPVFNANVPNSDTAYDHSDRYDAKQANIRTLRLSLVVRSGRVGTPTQKATGTVVEPFQKALENFTASPVPTADGFYRASTSISVRVPNLTNRSSFNPPINTSTGDALNVWGG